MIRKDSITHLFSSLHGATTACSFYSRTVLGQCGMGNHHFSNNSPTLHKDLNFLIQHVQMWVELEIASPSRSCLATRGGQLVESWWSPCPHLSTRATESARQSTASVRVEPGECE